MHRILKNIHVGITLLDKVNTLFTNSHLTPYKSKFIYIIGLNDIKNKPTQWDDIADVILKLLLLILENFMNLNIDINLLVF